MGREVLSTETFHRVASAARDAGSATYKGEQRKKQGLGLDPLVDPSAFGVIRRSRGPRELTGRYFTLVRGTGITLISRLDTTGSMGDNVEIAMGVLPKTYELLATGDNPVLGRYDVQMITSIFQDVQDEYVLCISQAEMDERIADQMTLMVPESDGGDSTEDPQYGIFAAAYLTDAEINRYGLKFYDFTVTDAPGRDYFLEDQFYRIFGKEVFQKANENGHKINPKELPSPKKVAQDLLKKAHAFALIVRRRGVGEYWEDLYGKERVVYISDVKLLPEIQSVIIGLTEGVLSLQDVDTFLKENTELDASERDAIKKSVMHIPVGAQMELENFDKIPEKGSLFESKDSLWPIDTDTKIQVIESEGEEEETTWS